MNPSLYELLVGLIVIIMFTASMGLIASIFTHKRQYLRIIIFLAGIAASVVVAAFSWGSISNNQPAVTSQHASNNYFDNLPATTPQQASNHYSSKPPVAGDKIYLRLFKQERRLEMWFQHQNQPYQLYKSWEICTYSGGLGPKKAEGDGKSPEGFYATQKNLLNPHTNYHLSFNIGYPNSYDRAKGYTGSYIMIHGKCVSIGCYAMTDENIEQIYSFVTQALNNGQKQIPIHIFPFEMNQANMQKYQTSIYYPFWLELKPAYDLFEQHRRLPKIEIRNQQYSIS